MDIKEFKKNVKNGCRFMTQHNKGKDRKECINTLMCDWNKCQQEQQDFARSQLTDADYKSCKNKNYSREKSCRQRLTKKKGLMDKHASLQHCRANKCPKIQKLLIKSARESKQYYKKKQQNSNMDKRDECIKANCSSLEQESDKQFELIDKTKYDCEKKFETEEEQEKCLKKNLHKTQIRKIINKANDCRNKTCKIQISNSNSNSKSKSNSKKQVKTNKK